MTDLCCVNGPWQLITLVSALQQEYGQEYGSRKMHLLVLVDPREARLEAVLRSLVSVLGRWESVTYARRSADIKEALQVADTVITGPCRAVSRVWITSVGMFQYRTLSLAFPTAEVVLYEDGLGSATEWAGGKEPVFRDMPYAIKWLTSLGRSADDRRRLLWPDAIHVRAVRRRVVKCLISEAVLSIASPAAMPWPIEPIRNELIYANIERCATLVNDLQLPDDACWILGGNSTRGGELTATAEYRPCIRAAQKLFDLGCEVVWKPHPRADGLYTEYLTLACGPRLHVVPEALAGWPLEVLLERTRAKAVLSLISTSLFYASLQNRYEAFTLLDDQLGVTTYASAEYRQKADMCRSTVQGCSVLFESLRRQHHHEPGP